MTSETVWTWIRRKGKIFKIISDPYKGVIEVLNEKGETIIRKTNLTRSQVEMVEKHFLHLIAKKCNETNILRPDDSFDPMIT